MESERRWMRPKYIFSKFEGPEADDGGIKEVAEEEAADRKGTKKTFLRRLTLLFS